MVYGKDELKQEFIKAYEAYINRSEDDCEIDLRDDLEITASAYYSWLTAAQKKKYKTYHSLYDYAKGVK